MPEAEATALNPGSAEPALKLGGHLGGLGPQESLGFRALRKLRV